MARLQGPSTPPKFACIAAVEPQRLVVAAVEERPGHGGVVGVPEDGAIRVHDVVRRLHGLEEFGGDVGLAAVMTQLDRIKPQWQARSPALRQSVQC